MNANIVAGSGSDSRRRSHPIGVSRAKAMLAVIGILLVAGHAAQATFPGANGSIVYPEQMDFDNPNSRTALFTLDTGQITFPAPGESHTSPSYSPDGNQLAYIASGPGPSTVVIASVDGSNPRTVLSSSASAFGGLSAVFESVTWLADGQHLAVNIYGPEDGPVGGIWILGADGSGLRRAIPANPNIIILIRASPIANEVVAVGCSTSSYLCFYDLDSGTSRAVVIRPPGADPSITWATEVRRPRWTPDGKSVVFVANHTLPGTFAYFCPLGQSRYGQNFGDDVFLIHEDGSGLTQLTHSFPIVDCVSNPNEMAVVSNFQYVDASTSPDRSTIIAEGPRNASDGTHVYGVWEIRASTVSLLHEFPGGQARFFDWQPIRAPLSVNIDDGHGNPLRGLSVQLCRTAGCAQPSNVIDDHPTSKFAGNYAFTSVVPGDYVVRATLVDNASPPAFGVLHFPENYPAPQNAAGVAWIEISVHVPSGSPVVKTMHFDDSAPLHDSNVAPVYRDRLDDMANIYFRLRQYVDWVHDHLTLDTGEPVVVQTFVDFGVQPGDPLYFAPDDAEYRWDRHIMLIGPLESDYENRDGLPDDEHKDDAPENVEWHEFTHHLYDTFVDSSPCLDNNNDLEPNHGGYDNYDTCDSTSEGFAVFLPALADQAIDGAVGAEYAQKFDLESAFFKAWSLELDAEGNRIYREDLAVGSLFWDLVDANEDSLDTWVIGEDRQLHHTLYTDTVSTPLADLWQTLISSRPRTISSLRAAFGPSPFTEDLDGGGPDVAPLDEVFLMHGFFPVANQQSSLDYCPDPPDCEDAFHFDVTDNHRVGFSDHRLYAASGAVEKAFIPRADTPIVPRANVALHVQDSSGAPLSGATIDLSIQYPGQPTAQSVSRQLGSGDGVPVGLELPPYFDYLLPDGAPLPPCDPSHDVRITVQLTAELNGYVSPDTASFDNCTYQRAVASGSGGSALSYTMTFPHDGTPPVSVIATSTSVPPIYGGATTGNWAVILTCDDPVVSSFASGCSRLEYRIDGGPIATYYKSTLVSDLGQHTFEYRSVDGAGNAEAFRSVPLDIELDTDGDGVGDATEIRLGMNPNAADTDGDGLSDGAELSTYRTNPLDADSDHDSFNDGAEVAAGTNPLNADTDGDGLSDGAEVTRGTNPLVADTDGDGLTDGAEVALGTDPLATDTDRDGLDDGSEVGLGTNPLVADTDGDGLTDGAEVALHTDPLVADTDGDGLTDGDEVALGTDPLATDTDGDGLDDGSEVGLGTNPLEYDTDSDGLPDGFEVALGTNPLQSDSDGDGVSDGAEFEAGTNPFAADSDGDGVSDAADNCPVRWNPGQVDRDHDGLGDACDADNNNDGVPDGYTSWQLIGVTDDSASTPESLFALDKANASATFLMSLGNGGSEETIGFDPSDGRLYHASGSSYGDRYWESIDVAARRIVTSGQFIGPDVDGLESGSGAMVFNLANGRFLVTNDSGAVFDATSAGHATQIGSNPRWLKGLAFAGGSLYAGGPYTESLLKLDPADGSILSSVEILLDGDYVNDGINGLAVDPSTGTMWAIFRQSDVRVLGTIDPTTGIATSVGVLPDDIAGIVFVPEPGATASLAAGVLALWAMHRRRSKRAISSKLETTVAPRLA
jgi:hypothetical protein